MLHERLQADIVCEDCLRSLRNTAIRPCGCMCGRRVKLRQQESRLRAAGVADDETRQREAIGNKLLLIRGYISLHHSQYFKKILHERPPSVGPAEF